MKCETNAIVASDNKFARKSTMKSRLRALAVLMLAVLLVIPDMALAHDGVTHPTKTVYGPSTWYQSYTGTNGGPWMTLSTHRHYDDTTAQNNWASYSANAINDWSAGSHTVWLPESTTPVDADDIHMFFTRKNTFDHFGRTISFPSTGSAFAFFMDGSQQICNINLCGNTNTWWYAFAVLKDDGSLPTGIRAAVTSHELGHDIGLDHDGLDPTKANLRDGTCGGSYPTTIMDYDCVNLGTKLSQNWDTCGINHKYPDANYVWTGHYPGCDTLQY